MTPRLSLPAALGAALAALLLTSVAAPAALAQGKANPPAVTPEPPATPPPGVLDPFAHAVPPAGRPKCQAFRRVRTETDRLQARAHGPLPASERQRLNTQLRRARSMSPKGLTASDCGVAL